MKKIIKRHISIFTVVFLLCGTILILGTSILLSNFQYKNNTEDLISENGKLVAEKITYEGKIEMLESERDIQETFKDLALEDINTLRTGYDVMVGPFMEGMSDLIYDYDDMLIELFNDTYPKMSDFVYSYYDIQIDLLRDRKVEVETKSMEALTSFNENNSFNY